MKTVPKTTLVRAGLFFAMVLFASSVDAQLVHPGGWHTQSDLTIIRSKVKAAEEPWATGWNAVKDSRPRDNYKANVSPVVTDKSALSRQGHVAYQLTMKWVATGDQKYADAAMGVIDQWVETVDRFDVEGPTLTLSTAAGIWLKLRKFLHTVLMEKQVGRQQRSRLLKVGLKVRCMISGPTQATRVRLTGEHLALAEICLWLCFVTIKRC